jgi:hypothetical protein
MSKNENDTPNRFELTINGKTRSFKTGYDMWKWAAQTNPKMEFPKDDADPPSLSEWFEKLRRA